MLPLTEARGSGGGMRRETPAMWPLTKDHPTLVAPLCFPYYAPRMMNLSLLVLMCACGQDIADPASPDAAEVEDTGVESCLLHPDADGDGYGREEAELVPCELGGDAYLESGDDCDDTDAGVNPSANESCVDGVDNDCDGSTDYYCDIAYAGFREWGNLSIQEAIDALPDGGTVWVESGTYNESLEVTRAGVTVESGGGSVTVVGTGGYALYVHAAGTDLTVSGIDFKYSATDLSAVAISGASVTLEDCEIAENHALGYGGGIRVDDGGSLVLRDVSVHDNSATGGGGGLYVDDGSSVSIWESTIYSNATQDLIWGSAIMIFSGEVDIFDSEIHGHDAGDEGAIHVQNEVGNSLTLDAATEAYDNDPYDVWVERATGYDKQTGDALWCDDGGCY